APAYWPAEPLQRIDISAIVALFINGGLEDEGLCPKSRMSQYPAKTLVSNLAFSNVRVTIEPRTERAPGIIGMDQFHPIHAEGAICGGERALETVPGLHVVTGCQKMTGIKAVRDR